MGNVSSKAYLEMCDDAGKKHEAIQAGQQLDPAATGRCENATQVTMGVIDRSRINGKLRMAVRGCVENTRPREWFTIIGTTYIFIPTVLPRCRV